jgi:hypothetical protein
MAWSDEERGRSRRPDVDDREWSHRSGIRWPGDREVGWRCVRSASCTWRWELRVSWLSLKTKVDGLWVVWHQNHSDGFLRFGLKISGDGFLWFGLKTSGSVFSVWVSKPAATVWWFESQNHCDDFLVWSSKPSRLRFIVCAIKRTGEDNAGHTSRSGGLLHLKASRARVFQSGLKTGRGATAGGARDTITDVASGSSWRKMSQCDGLYQTLLPLLYHF